MNRTAERDGSRSIGDAFTFLAGLLLATSAFTGWYAGDAASEGVHVSITGWDTGVLGKLVLVLGLASIAFVALRQVGIDPPAGVPESLITIALGGLATIFTLIRVVSIPDAYFFAGRSIGIWIALAAAVSVLAAGLLHAADEL